MYTLWHLHVHVLQHCMTCIIQSDILRVLPAIVFDSPDESPLQTGNVN